MTAPHPAKWSEAILDAIADNAFELLGDRARVLDPFAGVGLTRLADHLPDHDVAGVELEPEWTPDTAGMVRANTLALPFRSDAFDVLVTSPAYGNRMADAHEARDRCRHCSDGSVERLATPEEVDAGCELGIAFDTCRHCGGSGLSKRNTYRHSLGRRPSADSSTTLQWGDAYRAFHERAWRECDRVLRPGAFVFLNVKNHIRDGKERHVAEWHLNAWLMLGAAVHHVERIRTPGNRFGENGEARLDAELLLVLTTRPA